MRRILPLLLFIAGPFCAFAQKECGHAEYEQKVISVHPELIKKFQSIEALTTRFAANSRTSIAGARTEAGGVPDLIIIPVVVHVLYSVTEQNISDAQILSQIEVITNDYRGKNADRIKMPGYFDPFAADCGIEFRLANIDPKGFSTNGIIRKKTSIQVFGLDDRIKSSLIGGDDGWDPNKYLNIWVGKLAGGILGYASPPGGPVEKDGVVVNFSAFGTIGALSPRFNLGRTATHEIGHWLNLRHIWGDSYCGDDKVDDTPKQRSSNRGCPGGEKLTCETNGHGDMYMNFMDLTDDPCMYMFTKGQRLRMRALFEIGGPRDQLLSSDGFSRTALPGSNEPTEIVISASQLVVYPNPASSTITIEISGSANVNNPIIIYNSLGQPAISQSFKSSTILIDISRLKAGVYFIKCGSGEFQMKKFVKN